MINNIRNFCIIAHIDHGKSTLADRFLEVTKTVSQRDMKDQMLDQMDLERERGITIKLQPVRMQYEEHILNLIDTPGHVDFSYEVSRSLAAVEGCLLLVDATQGIEAQTLANLYLAVDQDLTIIPVINKIDLPNADIERVRKDLVTLIGCQPDEILTVSAKTGEGVDTILKDIIKIIPPPSGDINNELSMLIFDSFFDEYKGAVIYGRVVDGAIQKGDRIRFLANGKESECLDVGIFKPQLEPKQKLSAGEIGYAVTGLKDVRYCQVGDTVTLARRPASQALTGYKLLKPMVFAGIYCREGDDFPRLRDGLEKMSLNDAALTFEPDRSEALGFGFRCGFLGVLHLEIFQERLAREYNLKVIVTAPSVGYKIKLNEAGVKAMQRKKKSFNQTEYIITSPLQLPETSQIENIQEPWVAADVIAPQGYIGGIMTLVQEKRGVYRNTEYLDQDKVILHFELPLAGIIIDFYDKLKSVSSGFASLNYNLIEYRICKVTRLDIVISEEKTESLSSIVYTDEAYRAGRVIVDKLKEILPRQMFELKIQAVIGGKVIAASRISALRKDVTANLYGGDVTRKRKLLEKQKKGKKRMKKVGRVDIPQEAFLAILKR